MLRLKGGEFHAKIFRFRPTTANKDHQKPLRYPFNPCGDQEAGLFLIQDPEIRARTLPLFIFPSDQPETRPVGQGTTFRVDPWASCATAFHVFEEVFYLGGDNHDQMLVKQDLTIVALEVTGIVLGAPPIRPHQWRTMAGSNTIFGIDKPPLQLPRLRNVSELLRLSIPPSAVGPLGAPYFEVDLHGWRPSIGEIVLGVGYPGLDVAGEGGSDDRPISQYLYGKYGKIIEVVPTDGERGRPWPLIRVDADWPGGMSGGPVFDATGRVVGLISAGLGDAGSSATFFAGWNMARDIFTSLDPDNPGWFRCYGVFDDANHLVTYAGGREHANTVAAERGLTKVSSISVRHPGPEHIRLEL